jgi:penicillin-binding protein 1A
MSVEDHTLRQGPQRPSKQRSKAGAGGPTEPPGKRSRGRRGPHVRHHVRWLRMFWVTFAFLALAAISMLFGLLTAMASDLPQLENRAQFKTSVDSYLYDASGQPIGALAPPSSTVLVTTPQLQSNRNMVNAIVSVEDKRFWTDPGIDVRGLARAVVSDVSGGQYEGASTIPEEFVKNVEQEEDHRTVFEKLREAGLAFQLTQKWPRWKIMTEYLNTIYFGNGATGIEAAARTYFGKQYGYNPANPAGEAKSACGDPDAQDPHRKECVEMLTPAQAALLAGMVANPTQFDPILHPGAAKDRRDRVLFDLYEQHYIDYRQYQSGLDTPLPTKRSIAQPQEPSSAPYFISWVRPLVVKALEHEGLSPTEAQYQAYYGGLKIKLSLNLDMQQAAQQAVDREFPAGSNGPTASLVAIDNRTGEVRAMISGDGDYSKSPFNLATLGYRQPGSAFKMFTLASALAEGKADAYTEFDSKPISIPYQTPEGYAIFHVKNFGNEYAGLTTLAEATTTSDNSVFAQLGTKVGTTKIAAMAKAMGIRSSISTYPSMILGGLTQGVSALDMAHAYETAATGGLKVTNPTLGDVGGGPIGIAKISGCKPCTQHTVANHPTYTRVFSTSVADQIHSLLEGPVSSAGTGSAANIEGAGIVGKTGTTSNYVDAWFVGWTSKLTVAVWVGYASSGKPMLTNYDGQPVEGGTYPAIIFHNFMVDALQILADEQAGKTSTTTTYTSTDLETTPTVTEEATTTASPTATSTNPATSTKTSATGETNAGGTTGTGSDTTSVTNGTSGAGSTGAANGGTSNSGASSGTGSAGSGSGSGSGSGGAGLGG